jgi:hypothetical protein
MGFKYVVAEGKIKKLETKIGFFRKMSGILARWPI